MFPLSKKALLCIVLILTLFYLSNFSKPEADQTQINCEEPPFIADTGEPQPLFSPKTEPVISSELSFLLSSLLPTESVKIWVFFTDKGVFTQEDYNKSKASFRNSLCPAALKRRVKNKVRVDFFDLPPNQNYVEEILSQGAKLRQKSRWLNAASFEIQASKVEDVANLPFVRQIKRVAGFKRKPIEVDSDSDFFQKKFVQPQYGRNYGSSLAQLDQINVPIVHDMGYNGQNVIVCMLDTGYKKDHQAFSLAFSEGRVLAEYDFINHDSNTQNEPGDPAGQHYHGTYCWSTLGGAFDEKLYGPSYGASFLLAKTEDISSETPIEEDNWVAGMEWGDSLGAEVISSSLGYFDWYTFQDFDGNTAVTTIAADIAASRGIVVCNAMGNEGPGYGTLIAPADADSILACGAVDASGSLAGFSSWGPTFDGRIKPEVVARGVKTYCADAISTYDYAQVNGTSLSTPLVGGCAAVLLSAHPDWTVMQVREALMMTASKASSPDIQYGWGIVDLFSALNYNPLGALTIVHDPSLWTSDTLSSIRLTARITSENSLNPDSLFLFWRTDTLSFFFEEILQPLDSNQYQAQIPALPSGTTIFYYFSAHDSLGNVVSLPLGAPRFIFKSYVAPASITFDFENGLYFWETGGINDKWNINSVSSHGGLFSLTDSPIGGYSNNTDSWVALKQGLDLTSAMSPQLSFWHRYSLWVYDSCFVEISTDKKDSWERLLPEFGGSQSEWSQVSFPLDSYVGCSNFKFRFHFISDSLGTSDGWYIDDVKIRLKPTSVPEEPSSTPDHFTLYQNYPNPFNPTTKIQFRVESLEFREPSRTAQEKAVDGSWFMVHSPLHTTLKIYNIVGQLVKVLVDEEKVAGTYTAYWDGKDQKGQPVSSGIYFYKLDSGDFTEVKKMVLIK
jgi:serine protease AprX